MLHSIQDGNIRYMLIAAIVGFVLLVVIVVFASPRISPIPYFPSHKKDIPLIVSSLKISNNQVIFDLGAGDGVVIFAAALDAYRQNINTRFVAIELNPILGVILHLRRLFHPNKNQITIAIGNMFRVDYPEFIGSDAPTFYIYVSPRFIPRIINHVRISQPHFRLVSYFYPIYQGQISLANGEHPIFASDINNTFMKQFLKT